MGYRYDEYEDEVRSDQSYGLGYYEPDPDGDACGPQCRGWVCCRTASQAAARYCGCGGGVDHSDCPEVEQDWRAYLDGEEIGAGWSEDEARADAESVTLPDCWGRIEVREVGP